MVNGKIKKLLKDLIQIPSFSGKEGEIKKFILTWLKKRGLPIVRQGRNLLIHFQGRSKKALVFNAHLDTVLPGDLAAWQNDPFKGVVKKNKIYGLGASDEKASVASLLLLAEKLSIPKVSRENNLRGCLPWQPWEKESFLSN